MTKIQTTGSYDGKSGDFSISICPNDNHLFTLDGLSVDDMKELKSLVDILLESYEDERSREYNLREAEYYDKRVQLDMKYNQDKVKKWILPTDVDGSTGDIIVNLPDDLLKATNLNEGDYVEWISNDDGTYTLKKVTKPLSMEEC